MLRSRLCDYSDAYILFKGTITVENTGKAGVPNNRNKKVAFKNCKPFTDCISEIRNKEIDHPKSIDVVMLMYFFIKCSDNYSKVCGSLWQYYRVEPFINNNGNIISFSDDPDSALFKYKQKITDQTWNDGTKDVQKVVSLNYLSDF